MMTQRWRSGRDIYRPAGEPIDPTAFDVAPIADDTTARAFVLAHHYSGSYPAARWRFGLYRRGELAGVAVFSHPTNDKVLTGTFAGVRAVDAVELGRFVLTDDVPANGETWFLARCLRALRAEGLAGVVSFSDPSRRTSWSGATVFGGHVGTIYQAGNGRYLGRGTPRTLRLLPDGRVLNARTISKIRARERGWRYAAGQLVAAGAPQPGADPRAWLREWVPRLTRPLRHRGNHRYAWALSRSVTLPPGLPFPKQPDQEN